MSKIILVNDESGLVRSFFSEVINHLSNHGLEPDAEIEVRRGEEKKTINPKGEAIIFAKSGRVIYRTRRRTIEADPERIALSIVSKFGKRQRRAANGGW